MALAVSQHNNNHGQFVASYQVHHPQIRPVIERGASWSYNETRILLSLWEKIAERIREHGFDRTADQVRTRVFNMIAEYRRILKNPTPERKKKCIFFDALHKIYQAKDSNAIKMALNNYEEEYNFEPIDFNNTEENMEGGDGQDGENSGSDNEDKSEIFAYSLSPSATLNNTPGTTAMNGAANNFDMNSNNDDSVDDGPLNMQHEHEDMMAPPPSKRSRVDSNAAQQQYQTVAAFDASSSALLIDRMFAHLAKETEVMREWVNLERDRLSQEVSRRREESERDERREKSFLQVLMKMQEQMFSFLGTKQLSSSQASTQPSTSPSTSPSHSQAQTQKE